MNIEIRATRSGHPTLLVNGRYFHSSVDPVREAERQARDLADSSTIFILSPGLGYLAKALAPRHVVMIERHPEIAVHSGARSDIGLSDFEGKVSILSGVMLDEDREYYESIRKKIVDAIDRHAEHVITSEAFGSVWEKNLRENSARFPKAVWYRELSLGGRDIIVLSAGPTLAEDLPSLKDAENVTVIATDSAFPITLARGIRPDYVVTIDPQPIKARLLDRLDDIPLIASVLAPPETLARARTLYLFAQGHPLERELGVPGAAVMTETGGSVATAAATIAARLGARSIVLVGQDLAILDGRTHAKGTVHDSGGAERFSTAEHAERNRWRNLRAVPSVTGETVLTTPVLEGYRKYFERLAGEFPGVRFIQTSSKGAKIDIERMSLKKYLKSGRGTADNT